MKRWWATHPQSFADLVFASERIEVDLKRGKFNHPAWTNEKTGANKEGEDDVFRHFTEHLVGACLGINSKRTGTMWYAPLLQNAL